MTVEIEKLPPQNISAERSVLGSMILDKEAVPVALEIIKNEEYFYVPSHQQIFKSILDLYNANQPIDITTVMTALLNKNILDDVGGYTYLLDITSEVATTANIEQYCRYVEEPAQRRELIKSGNKIISDAYDTTKKLTDVIEDSEKNVLAVGEKRHSKGLVHVSSVVMDLVNRYANAYDGYFKEDKRLKKTRISALNDLVKVKDGQLIIIAGRPAMGKSAFALNIALDIAIVEDLPVAIFSLEMDKEQVINRMLVSEVGIPTYRLESGNISESEYQMVTEKAYNLQKQKIYVDDFSEARVPELLSKGRKLKQKYKKVGAVIVDYLQLMEADGNDSNRVNEIAKITRGLKKLAGFLECPVFALSQLSRKVEERQNKRPQLSDLRDSGSVEQDSDIVLFVYRDEYYNKETNDIDISEIICAKQREGPTGTVKTYFKPELMRFTSLER